MLEAHIAIEAPRVWREDIVLRQEATVRILDWLHLDECCCRVFVEIRVKAGEEEAFLRDLASSPTILEEDLQVVSPGIMKGALSTNECLGCCSAIGARVFQVEGSIAPDGTLVQVVVAPDKEAVRAMVSDMEQHGHQVTLLKLSSIDPEEVLTSRQETVLLTALERGYFDHPKGTSLRDLADTFQVSVSTASEMLRKATYKVMDAYFS